MARKKSRLSRDTLEQRKLLADITDRLESASDYGRARIITDCEQKYDMGFVKLVKINLFGIKALESAGGNAQRQRATNN